MEEWTDEEFFAMMETIARDDVKGLEKAQQSYGDSWKKRGGVGAFMMMARKWDRIELQVMKELWDIFQAIQNDPRSESIIDDIRDLRRYLFLIETLMAMRGVLQIGNHRDSQPVVLEEEHSTTVEELNDTDTKEELLRLAKSKVSPAVVKEGSLEPITDEEREEMDNPIAEEPEH